MMRRCSWTAAFGNAGEPLAYADHGILMFMYLRNFLVLSVLTRDSSPRAIEPSSETIARFESARSKPPSPKARVELARREPDSEFQQQGRPRGAGGFVGRTSRWCFMWPGTGRRRRRIVVLKTDLCLHPSGAAAWSAAWRPPPAASRRSHRHEIGRPGVISAKIAKELASWPFCMQFSRKARREVRNRDDMA